MSPKKIKIRLTDRDLEIFRFLFENRLATSADVAKELFKNESGRSARARLKKLIDCGYVSRGLTVDLEKIYFYFLTHKALKKIYPDNQFSEGMRLMSPNLLHDYTLLKVRNMFKKSQIIHSYYTENMIAVDVIQDEIGGIFNKNYGQNFRPDAIFVTETETKKFHNAVELEMHSKSIQAYRDKIHSYYENKSINTVVFISRSESIQKKVMTEEKRLCPGENTKIFYCVLKRFLKSKPPFPLVNCSGREWNFE